MIVATIDLPEWLILTGKGQASNFSVPILAGSAAGVQTARTLNPVAGYERMMIHAIQFDGVLSGQIVFQIIGMQGSLIGGYAVQSFIQDEILLNDSGMPFQFLATSTQTQGAVLNIDFIAFQNIVWEREVLPFLSTRPPGAR